MTIFNPQKYKKAKREGYKETVRKTFVIEKNGRSTDFIIPSFAVGCDSSNLCSYCYVARTTGFGNPQTSYTNWEDILLKVNKHFLKQPPKIANQCDPVFYTYDIGCNTDCLANRNISATTYFMNNMNISYKTSFATKLPYNIQKIGKINNPIKPRVRVSLIPKQIQQIVEYGTNDIETRIKSIPLLFDLGYEVHVNFSPIIAYKNWIEHYSELMNSLNYLPDNVKLQLQAECFFLSHADSVKQQNALWNTKAEYFLSSAPMKPKLHKPDVLWYKSKHTFQEQFLVLWKSIIPWCNIRYFF